MKIPLTDAAGCLLDVTLLFVVAYLATDVLPFVWLLLFK